MPFTIEQTRFELLPTGDYAAVIKEVDLTEGRWGPQVAWTFEVAEGDHAGATLRAWTSAKFSSGSKSSVLYRWTRAALNQNIPDDYRLESGHLVGRTVTVTVIVETKASDGSEFNKITNVRPYRPTGQVALPSAPVAQQPAPPPTAPAGPPAAAPAALPFDGTRPPAEVDDIPF